MKTLFDVSKANTKVWREFPNGSHNDTVAEPRYFHYIDQFIVSEVLEKKDEQL
jgi:hypothetical protein